MKKDILHDKLYVPDKIPDFIDENIEQTLENLDRSKIKHHKKTVHLLLIAACILTLTLGTIGVFAKDKISTLLTQYLNPQADQYEMIKTELTPKILDEPEAYKEDPKQGHAPISASSNGVTVTFTDMSYDGRSMIIGAEINLSNDIIGSKEVKDIWFTPAIFYTELFDTEITVKKPVPPEITEAIEKYSSGEISKEEVISIQIKYAGNPQPDKNVGPRLDGSSGSKFDRINNNTFKGYISYSMNGDSDPSDYKLTFFARDIDIGYENEGMTLEGSWLIHTGYSEKDIYVKSRSLQVNPKAFEIDGQSFHIREIFVSPINTLMTIEGNFYDEKYISDDMTANWLHFFVIGKDGKCLNSQEVNSYQNAEGFHRTIRLKDIQNENTLEIIPYMDNIASEKIYRIPFDQLPNTLKVQDMNVNIYNFEKTDNMISFCYTTSGLIPEEDRVNIVLCNQEGETFIPDIRYVDYKTGIGYAKFSNENKYNNYSLQDTTDIAIPNRDYELLERYKFEITVK